MTQIQEAQRAMSLDKTEQTVQSPTRRFNAGRETIEKIGPSTLGAWMDCNERATTTDALTKAERDERDAGSRRLAYVLLVSAIGLYGAYAAWRVLG